MRGLSLANLVSPLDIHEQKAKLFFTFEIGFGIVFIKTP
jgi:hypothetical protein